MTSQGLAAVSRAAGVAQVQEKPVTVQQQIERMVPEFAKVAGKAMDPTRLSRIALNEIRREPKLAEDMQSFLSCVMLSAVLRLEPGVMGLAYLIPYFNHKLKRNICTFIPGWAGHVDLVNRAGKATVRTIAIREGDEFDYQLGTSPKVHFKPAINGDEDRPLIATCAMGHIFNAPEYPQIEVLPFEKARKHLNRYNKVGDRHYALTTGANLQTSHNFEMYARKIALLQTVKYVPKSIEWQVAAQLDYAADSGATLLTAQSTAALLEGGLIEQDIPPIDLSAKFTRMGFDKTEADSWSQAHPGTLDEQADWLDAEIETREGM